MVKVAVLGDTHAGARGSNRVVFENQMLFFEKLFFPYLKKHKIKTIMHLGDFFDNRTQINVLIAHEWRKRVVEKLVDYDTHVIVGNHDTYFKNTSRVNTLYEFLKGHGIRIYKDPSIVHIAGKPIQLIPWINEDNQNASRKAIEAATAEICMGHLELRGFRTNGGYINKKGQDHDEYNGFDMVLSGHFHDPSHIDNVRYIGAPYEMNWGDADRPRGFSVLDTETNEIEFVPNPHKLFVKIEYQEGTNPPDDLEGKFVKVFARQDKDSVLYETFLDMIRTQKPNKLESIEGKAELVEDYEMVDMGADLMEIINKSVDGLNLSESESGAIKDVMFDLYSKSLRIGVDT